MLISAKLKEKEIIEESLKVQYDPRYMFYNDVWVNTEGINNDLRLSHQFASVDQSNCLIGYIDYSIDNRSYNVTNLAAINFRLDNPLARRIFLEDLDKAVKDIFLKYGFNKVSIMIFRDNPALTTLENLIFSKCGRMVGVKKQECRLMNGGYYDLCLYEILKDDFIKGLKEEGFKEE